MTDRTDSASDDSAAASVAELDATTGVSRRGLLGLVGAGAAGLAIGAGAGAAGGVAVARAADGQRGIRLRLLRRAPGRHHDAGAGPPALRRVRHDGTHRPRRPDLAAAGLVVCRGAHDPGLEVSATGAVGGSPEAPPDDTGEALGLRRERADDHVRLRADAVRDRRRGPVTASPHGARPSSSGFPHSSATTSIPTHRAATCASRRAPTTRRSPSTPSATSAASPSAERASAGRSSASGAPPARPRPADAAQPLRLQGRHREHPRRRSGTPSTSTSGSRHPTPRRGWPAAPTSSRARSRCSSRHGTACGSRSRTRSSVGTRARAPRSRAATSSPSPTSTGRMPRARRSCPRTATCVSLIPTSTTASASCAAATTSSTATTISAGSTRGCSSSRTSAHPSSSCDCSDRCRPTS